MNKLVEEIMEYIKTKDTDYAIMINGKWGSGKTYFWNKELKPTIESTYLDQYDPFSTIYVSLYGVSSIEEINKKIFFEISERMDKSINKYMSDNRIRKMSEFTRRGLDIANSYGIINSSSRPDYDALFYVKDKVICFDDVERADLDFNKLLGYINDFIEHDHIKVILLTNEEELMKKVNSDEYLRLKEKVVGSTYTFKQNLEDVIRNTTKIYKKDREVYDLINLQIPNLIKIIDRSKTDNIRIFNHAIQDFYKLFKIVTKDYEIDDSIIVSMLFYTIAFSYDIKDEEVTISKLININSPAFRHFHFIENYLLTKNFDSMIFDDDMEAIADDDDLEGIDEENELHIDGEKMVEPKKAETKKVKNTKKIQKENLIDNFKNDEDEFDDEFDSFDEKFNFKDKIEQDDESSDPEVEEDFENDEFEDDDTEVPNSKPTKEYSIPYVDDVVEEEELPAENEEYCDELFRNIPMKVDKFFEMYEERGEDIPIFNYISTYSICQRLICTSDKDLFKICNLLKKRMKLRIINDEIDSFKKIGRELKKSIQDKDAFNKTGIEDLINVIDDITGISSNVETASSENKATLAMRAPKKKTTKRSSSASKTTTRRTRKVSSTKA